MDQTASRGSNAIRSCMEECMTGSMLLYGRMYDWLCVAKITLNTSSLLSSSPPSPP